MLPTRDELEVALDSQISWLHLELDQETIDRHPRLDLARLAIHSDLHEKRSLSHGQIESRSAGRERQHRERCPAS